jgi:ABC-2 type transport system ATP-binding protein
MIKVEQVSKYFKHHAVLDNITLQIQPGEHIALVGSNGAGKTTLIRCLLGEYRYQGTVTIGGLNPCSHRQTVLMRIGFVPQLPPPLKMPVGQLIQFAAGVSQRDPQRIITLTQQLGLEVSNLLHRPFVKLSGGQKQKLLIGIALGRDNDILILDEPAANLDPPARQRFFELLLARQQPAITLISSHRLDELARLVNRVVELDSGKIILDDRVADQLEGMSEWLCHLTVRYPELALTNLLIHWQFIETNSGSWRGTIKNTDRLRFLSILSRYASLLTQVSLTETR